MKHPSFCQVSFSRIQGNPDRLYGSSIQEHHTYVRLRVYASEQEVDEYGTKKYTTYGHPLVSINMSSAQFAELITTMNIGAGTTATLKVFNQKTIEPFQILEDEKQLIKAKFSEKLTGLVDNLKKSLHNVNNLLMKNHLNTEDRQKVSQVISKAIIEVSANIPFILDLFQESTEALVTEAKSELDSYLSTVTYNSGLKALYTETISPALPEKIDEDS